MIKTYKKRKTQNFNIATAYLFFSKKNFNQLVARAKIVFYEAAYFNKDTIILY